MILNRNSEVQMRDFIDAVEGMHDAFVFYYFDESDETAEIVTRLIINEECPPVDLGRGRRMLFHKAHVPNTQDHIHFLVKGTKIAAINRDGTAHDRSHGVALQRWALRGMAQHYPEFIPPTSGIIEGMIAGNNSEGLIILNEERNEDSLLPKAVMLQAVRVAVRS